MNKRNLLRIVACSGLILGGPHIAETQEPPDQNIVQRLQDGDSWLDKVIDDIIARKDATVVSELEYFSNLAEILMFAHKYIVIRGYDARFMESKKVGEDGVLGELKVPVMRGSSIYALMPEGIDTVLDQLCREISNDPIFSEKAKNIVIVRTSKPMDKGYILAGELLVAVWDSRKPSAHPESRLNGAYFRAFEINFESNELLGKQFLIETGQDSVYSNTPNSQGSPLFPRLEYYK